MASSLSRYLTQSSSGLSTVRLSRAGFDAIEIDVDNLSVSTVSRAFSIDPSTVWLKEEAPGIRAFFPDGQNKKFILSEDVGYMITHLVVEGSSMDESRYAANSSSGLLGCSTSLVSPGLGCSSSGMLPLQIPNTQPKPLHQPLHVKRSSQSVNVKIIQAKLFYDNNNKPEFEGNNQTFVEVSEETANINYILAAVQRKWGECYTVVTNDGLEIDDCSGTQGLRFWKTGSRKIYAVKKKQLMKSRKRRAVITSSSDSENDFVLPKISKIKRKSQVKSGDIHMRSDVQNDVAFIKAQVKKIAESSDRSAQKLTPPLKKIMIDSFLCCICHTVMTPPIVYTTCCNYLLGCKDCVDNWYTSSEPDKACPRCRQERANLETMCVNGLDEVLIALQNLENDDSED